MKKLFTLLMVIMTLFLNIEANAQSVDATTAWFNGEDFSSYTLGSAISYPAGYDWSTTIPVIHTNTKTNVTTAGNVLGFTDNISSELNSGTNIGYNTTKVFETTLSGIIYAKMSSFHCVRGSGYVFKNTAGNTVFGFGSKDNKNSGSSNLRYTLDGFIYSGGFLVGNPTLVEFTSIGFVRDQWYDWEMVIDLNAKKLIKLIATKNGGGTATISNISLTNGDDINKFNVVTANYYGVAGLDNVTIGELLPNEISDLTGDSEIQTTNSSVNKTYSLTSTADIPTLSLTDVVVPGGNIVWTISDWGGLSVSDQALVSLTRSSANHAEATLSITDAISADATITIQAVYGSTTLTKTVNLKAVSVAGLKELLLSEINSATTKRDAVTDSNPYITSAKSLLQTQIDAAQAVYDNPAATESDVNNATLALQGAETDFDNTMSPYNAFISYIQTVQTAYDTEVRTEPFFAAIKGTLNNAITTANGARSTISSTDDINTAKTNLEASKAQYDTDHPAFDNLQTQINNTTARLSVIEPRQGASFLMYLPSNVSTLKTSKTNAENIRDTGTTAVELNNANTSLAADLVTYGEPRNAPSTTDYYKIYTYGVDAGDGNEVKKIVYDDGGITKYTDNESVIGNNQKLWYVQEVSQNVYTIQLLMTGTYLNGNTTSTTITNFTLPEGKSQTGLTYIDAGYFLYNIKNSSNRYLEVDTWDAGTSTGVFYHSGTTADRLRFNYQFEPVDILSEINSANVSSRIYPTLTRDVINVEGNVRTIDVFSLTGQKVNSMVANGTKTVVNMSNLSSGAYIIRANMEDGSANMQNVILQK